MTHWLSDDERRAWKALALMELQLGRALERGLVAEGLSLSDYHVLATLTDEPDGRRRVVELGDELGWEKSRISHHVARMARRGLVAKVECPTDRRGAYVVVTEVGRRVIERAAPLHVAAVRRLVIDRVDPSDLAAVERVAERVLEGLAAERPTS